MSKKTVTLTLIRHELQVNEETGKEYKKCSIKTKEVVDEFGDPAWIGGWASDLTYSWQLEDVIEIEIELREYNGKTYRDFKGMTKLEQEQADEIKRLKAELGGEPMEEPKVKDVAYEDAGEKPKPEPEGEKPTLDDLPF